MNLKFLLYLPVIDVAKNGPKIGCGKERMLSGEERQKYWGQGTMIGVDVELEYLIKACQRVWISLRNAEAGSRNSERMYMASV